MCRSESVDGKENCSAAPPLSRIRKPKMISPKEDQDEVSLTSVSSLASVDAAVCSNNDKNDFTQGRSMDGIPINGSVRPKLQRDTQPPTVIIGFKGTWYDATKFAEHHPGGDIIYEFHQKDATAQFLAYHNENILQRYKFPTRGTYEFDPTAPGGSSLQGAWMKLNEKFEREGRYSSSPFSHLLSRSAIIMVAFVGMFVTVNVYNHTHDWLSFLVGATCMAGIWHQSGFMMHDAMHQHIYHDRTRDGRVGYLFGNILLGVSGQWWRDEHNEHHVFTNAMVEGVGPADPQMIEDAWIQDEKLIPYFVQSTVSFILDYQQYYFVPVLIIVGLLPIKIDAIANTQRYVEDWLGLALHIMWVGGTLWLLPSVLERVVFYIFANFASGCLGIQLLVSHYAKPWVEKEDTKEAGSWAERQVEAAMDIVCHPWLDWFHGGLHIHSVHHLFPRMCRCHYRAVYDDVLKMCEEHGKPVDRSPWLEAIGRCVQHFSTIKEKAAKTKIAKAKLA